MPEQRRPWVAAAAGRSRAAGFAAVVAVLLTVGVTAAHGVSSGPTDTSAAHPVPRRTATAPAAATPPSAVPSSAAPSATPSATAPSAPSTGSAPVRSVADALAGRLRTLAGGGASLSVAVVDLSGGGSGGYRAGAGTTYDTASVVKVDILAALLLRAQDAGRGLTEAEKAYAVPMIVDSDNASATALWNAIDGAEGLDAANRRLGLTATTAGSDGLWGLTQTTADDQVTLLSDVFGDHSPLSAASRAYVRDLMGRVNSGQEWGVSAAGPAIGIKNGWLQRSATGLWDINSVGEVTVGGDRCLLAVLSKGDGTEAGGISLVEAAARAAASVLRDRS